MREVSVVRHVLLRMRNAGAVIVVLFVVGAASCGEVHAVRDFIVLGGGGQYGMIWGGNSFGDDYEDGPGLGLGVKFTLGHRRMIGASFESVRFNAANKPPANSDNLPERMEFTIATLTGYQRLSASPSGFTYISLGLGLAQPTEFRTGDRTKVYFDRTLIVAGLGREMFITKTLALDICLKVYSMHSSEGNNQAFEVALGLDKYIPR
jgi:hypothetical protein